MSTTDATPEQGNSLQDRPSIEHFKAWLSETTNVAIGGKYRHRMLQENPEKRALVINDIKDYYRWAHRDAVSWIRATLGEPLDPLREQGYSEPIIEYPCSLKLVGQQGCFGEIFAGMLAEHCDLCGVTGWEVPAFLDRFHNTAFEELEARDPYNSVARNAFGRTGDDCLAFLRNNDDISLVLYCEAKCSTGHDSELIKDAHQKMGYGRPLNILQVIDILQSRGDTESLRWVASLRQARLNLRQKNNKTQQLNMISYICGERPVRKTSWIDREKPHPEYKAAHKLEALEIHLNEVEALIRSVYAREEWK